MNLHRLPRLAVDGPNTIANVTVPALPAPIGAIYIAGRKPAEVDALSFKVNGVTLAEFRPFTDDEGRRHTGGEALASLMGLSGPGYALCLSFDAGGVQLGPEQTAWIELTHSAGADPAGRTSVILATL